MTQKQKDTYDEVIQREKELKKRRREALVSDTTDKSKPINYKTYITGLLKGQITDFEYTSETILTLTVNTIEGPVEVEVCDSGGYSESNELVRLLEWKNIQDGQVGDLMGEYVTIKSPKPIINRGKNLENIDFEIYIPENVDAVGKSYFHIDAALRRFGLTNFEEVINSQTDLFLKLNFLMIVFCFAGIIFLLSCLISIPFLAITGEFGIILPILITVLTGIEFRVLKDLYRRYKNYRQKDAIKNQ